ncbi:MAG: TerB family tellurite resistance protein [Nitrospirae bacterium]|nr:TerB family tellurite resistance protein [Nitrospirota bacterium]
MVRTVTQFFKKYITSSAENPDRVSEHSLQIATAALLIEMMRSDSEIKEDERKAITKIMQSKFNLSKEEISAMIKFAEDEIRRATGYFDFTSLINEKLAYEQRVTIVEHLWEVAFSDAAVDKHEEHMVRKIAGLLHVDHKDFIQAKLKVRKRLLFLSY